MKKNSDRVPERGSSHGSFGLTPLTRPATGLTAKLTEVAPAAPRSIEVHIEELVLHGFSPADRRPIADAIERELSSLLAREGLPAEQSFEIGRVNGGTFRIGEKQRAGSAGKGVARAIYGGLSR